LLLFDLRDGGGGKKRKGIRSRGIEDHGKDEWRKGRAQSSHSEGSPWENPGEEEGVVVFNLRKFYRGKEFSRQKEKDLGEIVFGGFVGGGGGGDEHSCHQWGGGSPSEN